MAHVVDVAAYILEDLGSVSTMKLQKLAFYSQAYYLAEHGATLFPEAFEAWANGPVAPDLFRRHRGEFVIARGLRLLRQDDPYFLYRPLLRCGGY